jgi:hypothetical protein
LTKPTGKNNNDIKSAPIYTSALKLALDRALEILGQPTKEVVLEKFEQNGIFLNEKGYYALVDFDEIFEKLFGQDGASIVMEKLVRVLKEMGEFE